MSNINQILSTDSYKASHWLQYPPKTETVFSYIEARGGKYPKTVFFGLQMFLKEYLSKPITQEMIEEADVFFKTHGEPFNRTGWEYILNKYDGFMPLRIKAVAEGTLVPVSNALVTVENTDPECFWLTSYIETAILRAVWYPTTVATNSWSIKQVIREQMEQTCDNLGGLPFMLNDFGSRGVSSYESSEIAGAAHLVNFMGTDNIVGVLCAMKQYNTTDMVGFSVPAAEHSSITTWGKKGELAAYRNMLEQFGGKYPIIAVVSDSYDIYNAVEKIWGEDLKEEVINSGSIITLRPDSGDPASVVLKVAMLLDSKFGHTLNSKGYKVLKNVRIIQGDGINEDSIRDILTTLRGFMFSADNVVFGSGGALLQQLNRDTCKFAYKASWALIDGKEVDVYKDPITDPGKRSKRGRLMLYRDRTSGEIFTGLEGHDVEQNHEPLLHTVFENGKVIKEWTFEEVRNQSNV
jgi:nicotinamide phosphoribosyltransferase